MAALDNTRIATGSFGLVGRIGAYFTSVAHMVVDWNNARVTRNALNGLTDRELSDIGMCRGDIDMVAEGRR
ncbi:MAG: DUF1127 domain-containing protein [Ruegeria sp.]|uniref:DUF1127 domain-containing protein n=1 Tax=Ruegeria sp. ANG-S4 TaxID=1577904 RepID=UPI00057E221A|nr:DUF1127 domain-containing protein [Ruegeria sp. ANG-S4]KIC43721.1 hypothetical protein RA28_18955 [Ruegeria sp. ANG-S4]